MSRAPGFRAPLGSGWAWLARRLLRRLPGARLRIVLWNGDRLDASAEPPRATVRICDAATLCSLMLSPSVAFGDGFTRGRIQVEGDLPGLLEEVYRAARAAPGRGPALRDRAARVTGRISTRLQGHSRRGSRRNIHHHYDIGNDFYKLWLDSRLLYTCAYYPSPDDSLEIAQVAKMDHVCRKLELRPGQSVVEAGCGWGALALHMARTCGVRVRAFNISREQVLYARWCAREEGLHGCVEFVEDDYRNISGRFDAFVSVGMLEHVGPAHYRDLGRVMHRCLAPRGRGLLHFVGRATARPLDAWIRRRIFPGAYPPTLREALRVLEPWDFSVLDVENIRLHYARTLEQWLERFEKSADLVCRMFDGSFVRAWRLYLAGSLAAFRTGSLQLFQVVFARSAVNEIPWTRAPLYLYLARGGASVRHAVAGRPDPV